MIGFFEAKKRDDFVALVSCGKAKRKVKSKAKDLYTGTLTRRSIDFASRSFERWFILSAKYGLLRPDDRVEPYELKMSAIPKAARREWGARVQESLLRYGVPLEDRLLVLAGEDYIQAITSVSEYKVYRLFKKNTDAGMGYRMKWFKENPFFRDAMVKNLEQA